MSTPRMTVDEKIDLALELLVDIYSVLEVLAPKVAGLDLVRPRRLWQWELERKGEEDDRSLERP